jgi:IS5 family transposase
MKELFTDLSTVAAATAAADAAYQDDSDDTRAKRALLRPKKMAKACEKRPVANSKTHNVGDTIS